MTTAILGKKLREMYETPGANKATMIHLFGVIYAEQIQVEKITPAAIIKAANMKCSYVTEINKGINLAKYVTPKPEYIDKF
ncbi:MAG: hypothetical protein IKD04_10115 [Clostridia bacterium]|nr:hypothetical protein [Clostridia bacterium]